MCPQVHAVNAVKITVASLEQQVEPVRRPKMPVETPRRFNVDQSRIPLAEFERQQGRMIAPCPVKSGVHALQPNASESGVLFGHDQGVAQGLPFFAGVSADDIALLSQDEVVLPEFFRERLDEKGIDIGIDPAVLEQFFQADEIGLVGVAVLPAGAVFQPITEKRYTVFAGDAQGDHSPLSEFPIGPMGFMVIKKEDAIGFMDLETALDAEKMAEVEGLPLPFHPVDENELLGDRRCHRSTSLQAVISLPVMAVGSNRAAIWAPSNSPL